LPYLVILGLGLLLGRWMSNVGVPPGALSGGLVFLVFVMGVTFGGDASLWEQLQLIGWLSLLTAMTVTAGSVLAALVLFSVFSFARTGWCSRPSGVASEASGQFRFPALIMMALLGGLALGVFFVDPVRVELFRRLGDVVLYGLIFLVGFDLSRSSFLFKRPSQFFRFLWLPMGSLLGSLLGIVVLFLFLDLDYSIMEMAAVGAGMGWYSFSGVFLTQAVSPAVGALAFTTNFLREILIFLFAALMARYGDWVPVAGAGATAMDSTLPLLAKVSEGEAVLPAMISGGVLTALVPLLLPLLVGF